MKKTYTILVLFILALIFIISCGNDNSNSSSDSNATAQPVTTIPAKATAIFIDSVVEGLSYTYDLPDYPSIEGETDAEGKFEYYIGHPVKFFIGENLLGEITIEDTDMPFVSPFHLNDINDINDSKGIELLKIIQSLDIDNNLNNGISIDPRAKKDGFTLNLLREDVQEEYPDINHIYRNLSDEDAKEHFIDTITSISEQLFQEIKTTYAWDVSVDVIDAELFEYNLPKRFRNFDLSWEATPENLVNAEGKVARYEDGSSDNIYTVKVKASYLNLPPSEFEAKIYVKPRPSNGQDVTYSLSESNVSLPLGLSQEVKFYATTIGGGEQDNYTEYAQWSSEDEAIAEISGGIVYSKSLGETNIIAEYEGESLTLAVEVTEKEVTEIKITPENPSLAFGDTLQLNLNATYTDDSNELLSADNWQLSSSDPKTLIEVDNSGLVGVLINTDGTADVTAEYGGNNYSTSIQVAFKDINPPTNAAIQLRTTNNFVILKNNILDDVADVVADVTADDDYGVVGYFVSESSSDPDPENPNWVKITSTRNYSGSIDVVLKNVGESYDDNEAKTIYVWFKDSFQNISSPGTAEYKISSKIMYSDSSLNPLVGDQWHLKNIGQKNFALNAGTAGFDLNIEDVHNNLGAKGRGITIGVVDDGWVQNDHQDISNVTQVGATGTVGSSSTSNTGLIAMTSNNSFGGIGVAPKSEIRSFDRSAWTQLSDESSVLSDTQSDIFYLGYNHDYRDGTSDESTTFTTIESLLQNNTRLFVKSAGDNFYSESTNDTCSTTTGCQNTAHDPRNAVRNFMVVGAMNADGAKSSYSNMGSALWVSAPGGEEGFGSTATENNDDEEWLRIHSNKRYKLEPALMTTDVEGCTDGFVPTWISFEKKSYGFSFFVNVPINLFSGTPHRDGDPAVAHADNPDCDYNATTNGTKSAAAITAGVASLVKEANPSLTGREVSYILAKTADQINTGDSAQTTSVGNADLVVHSAWVTNAANIAFNNKYGFGKINAESAVEEAMNYMGQTYLPMEVTTTWIDNFAGATIPANSADGVSSSSTVASGPTSIETVQVKLNVSGQKLSNLLVKLASPSGTESILFTPETWQTGDSMTNYYIKTNAFLDESSDGDWILTAIDTSSATDGTLTDWSVKVFGH